MTARRERGLNEVEVAKERKSHMTEGTMAPLGSVVLYFVRLWIVQFEGCSVFGSGWFPFIVGSMKCLWKSLGGIKKADLVIVVLGKSYDSLVEEGINLGVKFLF